MKCHVKGSAGHYNESSTSVQGSCLGRWRGKSCQCTLKCIVCFNALLSKEGLILESIRLAFNRETEQKEACQLATEPSN